VKQEGISEKNLWALAERIVSRIVHDAPAIAEKQPPPPWVEPESALELLDKDWEQDRRFDAQSLTAESLDAIWRVWNELRNHIRLGNGKLPLNPSHFNDYLPLLFKILQDIDEARGRKKSAAPASPVDHRWIDCRRRGPGGKCRRF
jgi:hypothetical protein